MRLAFFHIGPSVEFATLMVASARKHMPGIEIVQMTNAETPTVEGVTRRAESAFAYEGISDYRLSCLAALGDGETIALDTDVIVQADLRRLFALAFDVALTRRYHPVMLKGRDITPEQPYNAGVMFSRVAAFWDAAAKRCAALSAQERVWYGEQIAIAATAREDDFSVLELPCTIFNRSPATEDEDVSGAYAVHYKGGMRKPWMLNRERLVAVAARAASGIGGG